MALWTKVQFGFNPGYEENYKRTAKKYVIFQNCHHGNYVRDFPATNQG